MLFTKNFHSKPCFSQRKFYSKSCFLEKEFFFKIVLFKNARKMQKLRILRAKLNQNMIFSVQFFFFSKSCFSKIIFSSKLCFLKIIFSLKSCFLKTFFLPKHAFQKNIPIQNLTRCINFNSKSDTL